MTDIAIVVPTMRPHHAARFMASLRSVEHGNRFVVYAVCHENGCADAWSVAGAAVVASEHVDMPHKVNTGYRATQGEPWVLFTGEDVTFHDGWDTAALATAEATSASVVGTNDLGNPRTMAGEHATHMLFRRTYIDTHGGSFDNPGAIMHEGYRHWFADDEIVLAAKQRNAWAPCLDSVVEHLHPGFGKGQHDDVYSQGSRSEQADRAQFDWRVEQFVEYSL